jgi:hypothetical protein
VFEFSGPQKFTREKGIFARGLSVGVLIFLKHVGLATPGRWFGDEV